MREVSLGSEIDAGVTAKLLVIDERSGNRLSRLKEIDSLGLVVKCVSVYYLEEWMTNGCDDLHDFLHCFVTRPCFLR